MGKKKTRGTAEDYDEIKEQVHVTLTPTAKSLLRQRVQEKGCKSLSDLIEKWARDEV